MKKKDSNNRFGTASKTKNIITTRRVLLGAAFVAFALAAIFGYQTSFAERNKNEKQTENVWRAVEESEIANRAENLPEEFQTLRLDKQKLASLLSGAPHESQVPLKDSTVVLHLPMPDGTFSRFRVQEAPVLEDALQKRFPEIKSYRAVSIDDAGTTARFDFTGQGFHATILTPDKTFSILPADTLDSTLYASFDGVQQLDGNNNFFCQVEGHHHSNESRKSIADAAHDAPQATVGSTMRTYRVVISTTYEYSTDLGGGTEAGTIASINTWMNAVNAIYERDLAIRLIVIDAPSLISLNSEDGYNDDAGVGNNPPVNNIGLLTQQFKRKLRDAANAPATIPTSSYNLGHLFARHQPGGAAGLGVVCHPVSDADGPFKAAGVTALIPTAGNLGSLQILVHEFGHMFNAPHNFNSKYTGTPAFHGCAGPDGTNRIPFGAFETGAGNTIMAYPNRCGGENGDFTVGDNVIGGEYLRFHASNFTQINDHVINGTAAQGTVCFTPVNTGNTPPTVSAGANYTIPKLTPFTLTATGSDPDLGDQNKLTYTWEQYQAGGTDFYQNGTAASYNDAGDQFNTTRPIFRAMPATTNPSRTFPSLTYILTNQNETPTFNNQNDPPDKVLEFGRPVWTAEELPRISRLIDFRVTARDTVGGVSDSSMTVTVDGNAGPFTVNDITGTLTGGTPQTITWNVNNTTALAANVRISLSTDGGQSFPITLLPNTPNDGSENVIIPNRINTAAARIKVEAVGNVFFDITGANFAIMPGGTCPIINDITPKVAVVGSTVEITGIGFTGANGVSFNGTNATFTVVSDTKITTTVPNGATGGAITVSKNGCGAAESANFTVCSGATTEIAIDDGTHEQSQNVGVNQTGYFVNRIKPTSYPATLSEVKLYFMNFVNPQYPNGDGYPIGTNIQILSAANPNSSTNIDNTNFKTRPATITAHNGFVTYSVDPITINEGEFIVGYSIAGQADRIRAVTRDITPTVQNRSYGHFSSNFNGIFGQPTDANYMIRAAYYSGACSSGECSPVISISDNTFETYRGGTAGQTGYYINRLTPSSYPATLTAVRVNFLSQPNNSYDVNKAITVLSAANPNGGENIDNVSFNTRTTTIGALDSYVTYPIDPITINSGDFLVGYSIVHESNPLGGPKPSVAEDNTPPLQGRSYAKDNGNAGYNLLSDANHAIRAVLFSNECSGCTYTITPTSQTFSGTGGSGTVNVTTQAGCPWTASRGNYWISMTTNLGIADEYSVFVKGDYLTKLFSNAPDEAEATTGTGSGSATFTVAANDGEARTGTITVAGQTFNITQAMAPTAATVAISGRGSISAGNSLSGAVVSLVDQTGQTRTTRTNSFGYYRFDEIDVGSTVVLSVTSRRYTFTPQVISVTDEIENLNFLSLQ